MLLKSTLIVFVTTLLQDKVKSQTGEWKCGIKGERCLLPFSAGGKTYFSCTVDGSKDGRPWCPTKIYANGEADLSLCVKCKGEYMCYLTGKEFPATTWKLSCPPGCANVDLKLWGNLNEFSADSYICAAAIHEGKIANNTGGTVTFYTQRWRKVFAGGHKNGVTSKKAPKSTFPAMKFKDLVKDDPREQLVFTTKYSVMNLPGGISQASVIADEQKFALGLAVDVRKEKIYWTDGIQRAIYSADFDGTKITNEQEIVTGDQIVTCEAVAVDWIHGNLFWTDAYHQSVSVAKDTGEYILTLIHRDRSFTPRAIALDPKNGYFYISDYGESPKIEKCLMSRKDSCETMVDTDLGWPSGLALDIENDLMCWTDKKLRTLSCAKLNGSNRKSMVNINVAMKDPFALALSSDRVYWTDWTLRGVSSADRDTGEDLHLHVGGLEKPSGLAIYDMEMQKLYPNQCRNALCSQLCVPSPDGYKCMCSNGFQPLNADSSLCVIAAATQAPPGSRINIYTADVNAIKLAKVDLDRKSVDEVRPVDRLRKVSAVAIDNQKNMLYWSDSFLDNIQKGPLSDNIEAAQRSTVLDKSSGHIQRVEGMVIDDITRLLYWTDYDLHGVFVMNLEAIAGKRRIAKLVNGPTSYRPRSLALDSKEGYMYIADAGASAKIQKCETKGDPTCRAIIQVDIDTPNGVAIDFHSDRLYFSDAKLRKIESSDLEGQGRRILLAADSHVIGTPFAVGVFKDRVYWNDQGYRTLMSVDKNTGRSLNTISRGLIQPMGMILVDPLVPKMRDYASPCLQSICRYLCVPAPRQADGKMYACLCPENMKGVSNAPECIKDEDEEVLCYPGYILSEDERSCVDDLECNRNNGGCLHLCINTIGSFKCGCRQGYMLAEDERNCRKSENLCESMPCQNDGTCQMTQNGFSFTCKCQSGFSGPRCDKVTVQLLKGENFNPNATIRLQCVAPPKLTSTIIWRNNRKDIDMTSQGFGIEKDGRTLVIYRPTYPHSGNYTCQVSYGGREYMGRETVVFPTHPQNACGKCPGIDDLSRSKMQKIFGGKFTPVGMAPFVAMLYKLVAGGKIEQGVFCGGSLIDTKHVVTAAHCLLEVGDDDFVVYVGRVDTKINVIGPHQQYSAVESTLLHPSFERVSLHADIAIITLKTPVYFTTAVKPICVPTPDDKNDDIKTKPKSKSGRKKKSLVFGWGEKEDGERSRYLLEVKLPLIKQDECEKIYPGEVTDTMFCAGGEKNKDSCIGDSGGPLALWSEKRRVWFLGGIVSWGEACGEQGKPGVYTKIGKAMRQWIYDNTDI